MPTLSRLIVLVLAASLLAGCGVRYAYSQLDWLVPRYVRDFVTLDREQRAEFDIRLADRLRWHCESQLPEYAVFLRDLDRSLLNGGASPEGLSAFAARAESLWRDLALGLAPDVGELLASLDATQVLELAESFDARNAKARAEFLEPDEAERHLQRVDRMERRVQRWLGRLNPAQRDALARWSRTLEPTTEAWMAHREAWQSSLLGVLQRESDASEGVARLTSLLLEPDAGWSDDYRAGVERNREITLALFSELYGLADATQRQRLSRRLNSYAEQFTRLACSADDGSMV